MFSKRVNTLETKILVELSTETSEVFVLGSTQSYFSRKCIAKKMRCKPKFKSKFNFQSSKKVKNHSLSE